MTLTKDVFLREVENHRMTVIVDDGLRRHLRFAEPGTYNASFDVLTWPGTLCYVGDMGCYVFQRIPDMFEFFRGHHDGNPYYWSQKLVGVDRHGSVEEFDSERFAECLRERFNEAADDEDWSAEERADLWEQVESDVLSCDGEVESISAAEDFRTPDRDQIFTDMWDYRFTSYTGRFLWCCFALPWAIAQYDASSESASADPAVESVVGGTHV